MGTARVLALFVSLALGASLSFSAVYAQKESATAEDGTSAPAEDTATTTTAPSVPVGANLTPPVGVMPPLIHPAGTGQSGSSSVSMAPGTLTSGVAREDENAVHPPPSEPAPETTTTASSCTDYPTWYDAQLALESTVDAAEIASLDPDGDAIACEEVMYPES